MSDPTDLRAQADREAEDRRSEMAATERVIADIKWQMSTATGRRVVWGLLEKTRLYQSSFTSNRSLTDFNEGQRNVGLYYIDLINAHCLQEFVLMLKEHEAK